MEPWLICAALFLPISWRLVVGFVSPWSRWPRVGVVLFLVPLIAVAASISVVGVREGEYLLGLPILLIGFWCPQLILIAFFAWCEREQSCRSSSDAAGSIPLPK
jgi:hypothetical protein